MQEAVIEASAGARTLDSGKMQDENTLITNLDLSSAGSGFLSWFSSV